jgi:hypothetical protein
MDQTEPGLSYHILPVSATLMGVSVTVLTLFQLVHLLNQSIAEEILAITALLFALSCLFSYRSLRNKKENSRRRLENIADVLFFISLFFMVVVAIIITFLV